MADPTITQDDWDAVANERTQGDNPPPPAPPPESTEPKVEAVETPAAPAPQAEEKVDPYANLHPDVRAKLERFDQLAASQTTLVSQLREATGRISSLQSQWDKAKSQLEAKPTEKQVAAAVKDPEKWASLKKDFPEWGEAIAEFVESRSTKGPSFDPAEVEKLVAQRAEATTAELQKKFNEDLVTVAHRNWRNDVKTEDFGAWYRLQPAEVQVLSSSTDPLDAIALMDKYHEYRKKPVEAVQDARKATLAAAVTTKPKAGGTPVKSIEDMTPDELWDHEAKLREKRAA